MWRAEGVIGKAYVVPEGGAIVCAKLFIEEDVAEGIDFNLASGRVPFEFTVVSVVVPHVVQILAIVWSNGSVKV